MKLKRELCALLRREPRYPVISNVNGADESTCGRSALLIYLTKPFLLAGTDPAFIRHQNFRQCTQIAAVLGEGGYIVDVMQKQDTRFVPSRAYDLIISEKLDWKGLDSYFKETAVRAFLATSMNHIVHNRNLRRRHELLSARRPCHVQVRRVYPERMPAVATSDGLIGFGNEFTMSTWKEVFDGPTYPFNNYGFEETVVVSPNSKDFETARRHFLFFASRSQVQKGLDLLLEVFPKHPDLHLYVCSTFETESDFCACYHEELFETPSIHPIGFIGANSREFHELVRRCAYVIHPTCSEGQPGSVVQCMYSGLIPLVTREAGIDTEDFGVTFADDSLDEIERVVVDLAARPAKWHRERSIKTRRVAEGGYSERAFWSRWKEIIAELEGLGGPRT